MALALKYRPKSFIEVIGQDATTKSLSLSLKNDRIAHAYLFSGLRGSGKTSSARIFARTLLCDKFPAENPCNVCKNCQEALAGRHIDIIELDAASKRKIENILDLIEEAKYPPSIGRFKIFIIDEVHMLTKEAFNAFLKTLEEPPKYAKFILATTDVLKLPSTILSRTQHYTFRKIPQNILNAHIKDILNKENISFEDDAIPLICRSSEGSVRDTLSILDMAINYCNYEITVEKITKMLDILDHNLLFEFFTALKNSDKQRALDLTDKFCEYEVSVVLGEMMEFLKSNFNNPKLFNFLLLERYFKIISETKMLDNTGADGSFGLILLTLKMLEAQKLGNLEDELLTLESNAPSAQNSATQAINAINETPLDKFNALVHKILDRNHNLGMAFKNSIEFVSFEQNKLIWRSNGQNRDILVAHYALIKQFVQEIFGKNTQISSQNNAQNTPSKSPEITSPKAMVPELPEIKPQTPPMLVQNTPAAPELVQQNEQIQKVQDNPKKVIIAPKQDYKTPPMRDGSNLDLAP
ncbi:MAG: DNA polymerase III subunit gamma/tau [Helicobacter sp.]|nr:DNA polymerase III subunit gamma/tau [Helicobacter sp.]